ncbi:uncharacterized protein LOC117469713 isoform X1 [Trematomus bernacchii]|uniref:uncharacterized protein LOC117469713 isoform X1 n=3 Tax=Trematomus bernacchii TaxID=40690 RepID=UPI00146ED812|nr:uncharacterized protein LOC117469713 isoform X1 [Trematomus bernacchii]
MRILSFTRSASGSMAGEMFAVRRAVTDAFWGMCAADSLSMPVHWFYDVDDIQREFRGWIREFRAPRDKHPSSIMSLSNTAGSGRSSSGSRRPDVVGRLILQDKLDLWRRGDNTHYHQGLCAGDNTLNVLCSLRVALCLVSGGFSDLSSPDARAAVLSDYVSFLTTEGSHRDSYAESFHRDFFCCWQDERPTEPQQLLEFAERRSVSPLRAARPDAQLDAIGCLPMILPFILLAAHAPLEQAVRGAVEMVKLTHPHPRVPLWVSLYGGALHRVLGGASIRGEAERALKSLEAWDACRGFSSKAARFPAGSDQRLRVHQSAVNQLGLACYTKGALSSLFYLALEFHDDAAAGILTNTNCGGENCNRGAALGALLGAGGGIQRGRSPRGVERGA